MPKMLQICYLINPSPVSSPSQLESKCPTHSRLYSIPGLSLGLSSQQGRGLGLDASVSRPSQGTVVPRLGLAPELVRLGLVSVSSSEGLGLGLASA